MAKRPRPAAPSGGPNAGTPTRNTEEPPRRYWRAVLLYALVAVAAAALFGALQFRTDNLVGFDGYYHIKYSYILRTGWLWDVVTRRHQNLPWLHHTIYSEFYRDHHFLFHLLLTPFTLGDLRVGAKVAAVMFPTLMAVSVFTLLRAAKVPWAMLWMIALAGTSTAFIYRMLMPRPMAGAVALLMVSGVLLIRRRPRALAALTMVAVWYYDGYGMILVLAFMFMVSRWITERRPGWREFAWCLGGAAAGIVINVYFPMNVKSYWFNFYRSFSGLETAKGGGSEWYQMQTWHFIAATPGAMIAMLLVIVAARWCRKPQADTIAFVLLAMITFLMASKAKRYLEYFPVVALMAAALTIRDLAASRLAGKGTPSWPAVRRVALAATILMAATPVLVLPRASRDVVNSKPHHTFKGAAEYMAKYSQPGDVVFNVDYDAFPHLFFHNHKNYYTVGLDPIYLDKRDPELFKQWRRLGRGRIMDVAKTIREQFGARWVVLEAKRVTTPPFVIAATKDVHDGVMRRVFHEQIKENGRDTLRRVYVYELKDAGPPAETAAPRAVPAPRRDDPTTRPR